MNSSSQAAGPAARQESRPDRWAVIILCGWDGRPSAVAADAELAGPL